MTILPRTLLVLLLLLTVSHQARAAGATPSSLCPVLVGAVPIGADLVILPDGRWEAYQPVAHSDGFKITRVRSTNQGRSWSTSEVVHNLPGDSWGGTVALLDRRGEGHLVFMRPRIEGPGQRIAIDLCIDIWHLRSLAHEIRQRKKDAEEEAIKGVPVHLLRSGGCGDKVSVASSGFPSKEISYAREGADTAQQQSKDRRQY